MTIESMRAGRRRLTALAALLAAFALIAAAGGSDEETTDDASAGESSEVAADDESAMDDMADGDEMDMDGDHSHDVLEVPEGMTVPTVSVEAIPDAKSGANISVTLTDFEISPENASTDPVDGQGHLHLYVDGERDLRFYNTDLHLGDLEPGMREITVEVSANNHSAYAVDGEPIRATTMVEVPEPAEGHSHGDEGIDAGDPAPTVAMTVNEDPKSGWNLAIEVTDFTITPENVNGDHVDGEGHLHLYVDGEKVTRLYGTDWHLDGLGEGSHDVMVELSANDHRPYQAEGTPITATATIEVSAEQAAAADGGHSHGDEQAHGDGEHGMDDMAGGDMDDEDMDGEDTDDTAGSDADVTITADYSEGNVTVDSNRFEVDQGDLVRIMVTSDVPEHVHLHGYDVLADITPEAPGELVFTADTPGVFEVELEKSFTLLFEVAVS